MFMFGSGVLFGKRTDVANSTPTLFGTLQEVQIDLQFTNKELYGQNQFPVAVARGEGKIQGKAKFASINGRAYNDLFLGQTLASGETRVAYMEAGAVPAASPYTVTVANAVTFKEDLGVINASTGIALVKVASAPATGQYSVDEATGTYTFAAADTGTAVLYNYRYTMSTAGSGQSINISNQLLGTAPQFQAVFYETYQSKQLSLTLNACISDKLSLQTKTSDFTVPEMDFSAFADAAGNIGLLSIQEPS